MLADLGKILIYYRELKDSTWGLEQYIWEIQISSGLKACGQRIRHHTREAQSPVVAVLTHSTFRALLCCIHSAAVYFTSRD